MPTASPNQDRPWPGRVESHGEGLGPVTPELVERRAQELARIEGRSLDNVTDGDRERARRELRGEDATAPEIEAPESLPDDIARAPDDLLASRGQVAPDARAADEQKLPAEEAEEGVREAEHERLYQGREQAEEEPGRRRPREDWSGLT